MKKQVILIFAGLLIFLSASYSQRRMENLGRGVVAVRAGTSSAFISWRLLGDDPKYIGFNVYKSYNGGTATKLNSSVLKAGTNYTDNSADFSKKISYYVKPVVNGVEGVASTSFSLKIGNKIQPCFLIPIKAPESGYTICDVQVGDLDGDGEYDYVIDRQAPIDPATLSGTQMSFGNQKMEAYKSDGTFLWSVDLGVTSRITDNVSPGAATINVGNWDGMNVYDLDGDGKAEVVLKTANDVTFGDGKKLVDSNPLNQYVSVLNGLTGAERSRILIPNDYSDRGVMGASFAIAYLDGIKPSIVGFHKNRKADGHFNLTMLAWDFNGTNITQRWKWMRGNTEAEDGHQMRIADVDGDGKDDVCQIGFTLNSDGTLRYSLSKYGILHGDRFYISKIDPAKDGLQGYGCQQNNPNGIIDFYYDVNTGKPFWKNVTTPPAPDAGRAMIGDIDPRFPGAEMWSFWGVKNAQTGIKITPDSVQPYPTQTFWWDGDLLNDNLNDGKFEKWDYANSKTSRFFNVSTYESAFADGKNPLFWGDILGDWRTEVIYKTPDESNLVIFTTNHATNTRLYTMMHNPQYRVQITTRGYEQSPYPDYYIGTDMTTPPTPLMQTAKCIWKGNSSNNVWDATTSNWVVNGVTGTYTQGDDVMFDLSGSPDTTVTLSGSLSPSSIKVISPVNYSLTGSGKLSGSTGLLKSGGGALSLNSLCEYTDTTRVEEGQLFVNGLLTQSTVLVAANALLGGAGVITKSPILNKSAKIAPGVKDGLGTLTFNSGLIIPANTICQIDLTDDSLGTLKPSDKIVVNGNLVINDTMTILLNAISGKVKPGSYPIISYTGSFSGNLSKISIAGLFGQKCVLSNSSNVITLTIVSSRKSSSVIWDGTASTWDLMSTNGWLLDNNKTYFAANDSVNFNTVNGTTNINIVGTLPVSHISVNSSSNNYTFSGNGNIGGDGGLTKSGNSKLSVLNKNSFTGKTIVNGGTLEINSIAETGLESSIGAPTTTDWSYLTVNNATLSYIGTTDGVTNRGLTLAGTSDTINVSVANKSLSFMESVIGTGKLVKTGSGTLVFNKANTYSGGTVIKDGIVGFLSDEANFGTNTTVQLEGGTLRMYNSGSLSTKNYWNFNVPANKTGSLITDSRCDFYGTLTGSGTMNLYLTSLNSYGAIRNNYYGNWSAFTGNINISTSSLGGLFSISNTSGYANASFSLGDLVTATHTTPGSTVTFGDLSGTSTAIVNNIKLVVGGKNTDATFNGVISGAYSVTKNGTGAWTLTNANTYSGGTTVSGGTLVVSNTTGSATGTGTVNISGAKLTGTGRISGGVAVNSGSNLAPGLNGIGTINLAGGLALKSGSTTSIEINKSTSKFDIVNVTGSCVLNGVLNISNIGSVAFKAGDKFKIFNATAFSGAFTSVTPSTPGVGLQWDLSAIATTGTISIVPVTSVEEISFVTKVYPNPINTVLHVTTTNNALNGMISIIDLTGKTLIKKKIESEEEVLNLSNIEKGIYFLRVTNDNKNFTEKLIKQ